jgi:hypothetical protein
LVSSYFFEGTIYWSNGDERAHFEWMARIGCVGEIKGVGRRVYLAVDEASASNEDVRELAALYRRYCGDSSQLAELEKGRHGIFLEGSVG